MRETRQSGSEGGARFNPLSLPLSQRFMGSFHLQLWTRIGAMNRRGTLPNATASWTAALLRRFWGSLARPRVQKRQSTGAVQNLAEFARLMENETCNV
jgi:hypothetical protein